MNVQYQIKENKLSPEDYLELRKSLKWEVYPLIDVKSSLCNSLYTVSVYADEVIIGAGRIVGDGKICFYIQDIMVHPQYQNIGIGSCIMNSIMRYLYKYASENAYIGLMSKIGKSGFYKKYGFISRPNKNMGPGMVLRNFKKDYHFIE